ncbi:uncharacterized protein [Clytia hemisphaerica]|uniref:Uncharacterized protein n=1 Tax=Clytia hemisphaerica TaxID=252671 RepID=A0A7M5V2D5_9CNID
MTLQRILESVDNQKVFIRELIDIGLLANQLYCENRHQKTAMRLQKDMLSWRCPTCTNKKSVKSKSFFSETRTDMVLWMKILNEWCKESTIREIATRYNLSIGTTSGHCKHFRELCQSWFTDIQPQLLGGEGQQVLVKIIKKCTETCNVLLLVEKREDIGYLIHNKCSTYEHSSPLPIKPGTLVFCEKDVILRTGCMRNRNLHDYQGSNIEISTYHALSWMKKKKGIRCEQAGGFVNEYNFRFFIKSEEIIQDRMIKVFKDVYKLVF